MTRPMILICAALALASATAAGAGFQALDLPGSQLTVLSRDGDSAGGDISGPQPSGFRWTRGKGTASLPGAVSVRGMSASGRYVVGSALDAEHREVAALWDGVQTPRFLDGLPHAESPGRALSTASGVTDRPEVIGSAIDTSGHHVAFEWTDGGAHLLPIPATAVDANAIGISDDGRSIFGWVGGIGNGSRSSIRWEGTSTRVLDGAMGPGGLMLGANRAGTVILGSGDDGVPRRWQEGHGGAPLSGLRADMPAPVRLFASDDAGTVLVGSVGEGAQRRAAAWTPERGLVPLDDFLATRGIRAPAGWTLIVATAISADGRHIAGWGQRDGRFDSFVADLPGAAGSAGTTASR